MSSGSGTTHRAWACRGNTPAATSEAPRRPSRARGCPQALPTDCTAIATARFVARQLAFAPVVRPLRSPAMSRGQAPGDEPQCRARAGRAPRWSRDGLSVARSLGGAGVAVTILGDGATDCLARRSGFCREHGTSNHARRVTSRARRLDWLVGHEPAAALPCSDDGVELVGAPSQGARRGRPPTDRGGRRCPAHHARQAEHVPPGGGDRGDRTADGHGLHARRSPARTRPGPVLSLRGEARRDQTHSSGSCPGTRPRRAPWCTTTASSAPPSTS